MINNILQLAKILISQQSVTPDDANCQVLIAKHLETQGFDIQHLPFGDVKNLWATHGNGGPVFVFAGHTDIVPPGPEEKWTSPPFEPTERDGKLFGRGAADMKSALAAMIVATEKFIAEFPDHKGTIAFLITSDEEGEAVNGTVKVIEHLQHNKVQLDYCVIGEASSEKTFGDTIKIGRRGSLNGRLTIKGKQGHIAYPHLADNPINKGIPALNELNQIEWDKGNQHFPPTQFQISNIHAGTGAENVIPGELTVTFNSRYSPETTAEAIQKRVTDVLDTHTLDYHIDWRHSGKPFYTEKTTLINATLEAVKAVTGKIPELSTSGGTSDGRFIAPTDCEVIELGPVNESIHKIDEHIDIEALNQLTDVYYALLERLCL